LHDGAGARTAQAGPVLPDILIEASDEHGPALSIEPGLDAITHMRRPIDPRVLIVGNTMFLPEAIANQIRSALYRLHLADQRSARLFTGSHRSPTLCSQRTGDDSHTEIFLW